MKRIGVVLAIVMFSFTFLLASIAVAQGGDSGEGSDSQAAEEAPPTDKGTASVTEEVSADLSGGCVSGIWQVVTPVNTGRSRPGLAYLASTGMFYLAGGEATGGNRDNPIEEYDAVANTWTDRTTLLTGVSNTGAAGVGPYVYVPGGFSGVGVADMQRFDPVANVVVTMTAMSAPNYAHAVTALDNKIYVLGGSSTGVAGTTNYIYDVDADSWSSGAALPVATSYAAATTDGTYVYVLGGTSADLATVQRYDPGTDSWSALPDMSTGRGGPGAFYDGSQIWAVAGGWASYLTSSEYFDGVNWQAGASVNVGVRTFGMAANDVIALKAAGWNGAYESAAEVLLLNCPPVAAPDVYTTTEDVVLSVAAPGVLTNDVDSDGDVITAVLAATTNYGVLDLHDNGSFVYTPTQNFYGMDSFAYYATDGSANSDSVEVVIHVTAVNDVPIANDDSYTTTEDVPLTIMASGVLSNDFDKDDGLHLYSISSGSDDLLREIDPQTAATLNNIQITLDGGGTVQQGTGLATHPQTGELYGLLKLEGQNGRELVTIDPTTGVATSIGDTGDGFAGITFADDGTLYGVTGDGASVPETLFTLDASTAISTMVTPLGHGDDGEALGFNPDDGLLYHASGHDTPCAPGDLDNCVIFESVARTMPYTVTNIPISTTVLSDEEAQALVYWQGGFLWKQDHGTGPLYWTTTDGMPTLIGDMDHQAKGLAFVMDSLTAVLDTDPTNGTVSLNADGSFTYTPDADFCGTDSFTYHATDGLDDSNVATVTIEITCDTTDDVQFIYLPFVVKD